MLLAVNGGGAMIHLRRPRLRRLRASRRRPQPGIGPVVPTCRRHVRMAPSQARPL